MAVSAVDNKEGSGLTLLVKFSHKVRNVNELEFEGVEGVKVLSAVREDGRKEVADEHSISERWEVEFAGGGKVQVVMRQPQVEAGTKRADRKYF